MPESFTKISLLKSRLGLCLVAGIVSLSTLTTTTEALAQANQKRLRIDWVKMEVTLDTVIREIPVHNVLQPEWDDSAIVIHHSVMRIPAGWLDTAYLPYKYVMCYTPFRTNSDENPHLAFSNDGNSWSEELQRNDGALDTVANPLWTPDSMEKFVFWEANQIIHLSDPDIIFDANGKLWMIFRVKVQSDLVTAKYQIVITTTEDNGLTWTTPIIIIDTDRGDPVKGAMWSPAIWLDSQNKYHMLGVYTNAFGQGPLDFPNTIALWSSPDATPDGLWQQDTVLNDFLPQETSDRDWWHPEILKRGDNELIMLMTTTKAGNDGSNAALFLATSANGGLSWDTAGQVFTGTEFPWTHIPFAYRCGALLTTTDSTDVIDFWLGSKDPNITNGENVRTGRARLIFTPPCDTVLVCPPCCVIAGDTDGDGLFNIGDVTLNIARIFTGGAAPDCQDSADANGDNLLNIADITFAIARIFTGGPPPICGTTYQ